MALNNRNGQKNIQTYGRHVDEVGNIFWEENKKQEEAIQHDTSSETWLWNRSRCQTLRTAVQNNPTTSDVNDAVKEIRDDSN